MSNVLAYTAAWKRRAARWKAAAKDKRRIGLAVARRAEEWSRRGQVALDRVDALECENHRLRAQLATFADPANWIGPDDTGDVWVWVGWPDSPLEAAGGGEEE